MLADRKLAVDTFSTVYRILRPWADVEFWDFGSVEIEPGTVCIIGRNQLMIHIEKVKSLANRDDVEIVFDNAAEGSTTLISQLQQLGISELALNRQIALVSGSALPNSYQHVLYPHLLRSIVDYDENLSATAKMSKIFDKKIKPYTFLFLNGRSRSHRKYLIERFRQLQLLNTALWSCLDDRPVLDPQTLTLIEGGIDLVTQPSQIKLLPAEYEYSKYQKHTTALPGQGFVKDQMFGGEWGEIYLAPAQYIDTYFSVVTETVFDYPYSFLTEKTAKPLMMGHPFVAVANSGFYRELHRLGFRTFGHAIDESFDRIDNAQDRIRRIAQVVDDLCRQDLPSFLESCYNTCKYNQQHLLELAANVQHRFPTQLQLILKQHG